LSRSPELLPGVSAVVPAAGRAERFGGGKLRALVAGEPLLTHTLRSLLDAGVESVAVVVAPDTDLEGVVLLGDARVTATVNVEPARGMFSSIQIGLADAAGDVTLVLPGDMPFVSPETVRTIALQALRSGAAVVPVLDGKRGHPVAIPGRLRPRLLAADAGSSLKAALKEFGHPGVELAVSDPGILRDVDVRGDLP
jgi:molybdenum cofactor cytidylyltransferase